MSALYKRHGFPPEIIAYAVWLYYRFALSFRDIEELLASRGVTVSYEAVRLFIQWAIQIHPLASYFNVRLIGSPTAAHSQLKLPPAALEFTGIAHHPT